MSDTPETLTAILLITVWLEPCTPTLRARVTRVTDVRAPGESTVVAGADAVLASVRDWLAVCEPQRP
ncbi:hypothetical protein ACIBU0_00155 [Streptomyces sp. NPDC049627]|uniref:hypothetical protein n=1 Tax=Streptomyces sp. NPDC049627 TaxID=3365595 RepID=UPI0037BD158E